METTSISKFRATCNALIERVRQTGEPLLVTKRGVPIAQIVPVPSEKRPEYSYGSMKGRGKILGDVVGPISSEEEWESDGKWFPALDTPTRSPDS